MSAASAALRRDGQLDRIRSGVYQWSAGQRAAARRNRISGQQEPLPQPAGPPARPAARLSAADLFTQLFPAGVQMTGELLADLEQWARLTGELSSAGP